MLAENKYKELVEAEEWNQPTEEQKKIIALTAQLGKFEKANMDLSKKLKVGNSNNGTKSSKQDHNKRSTKQSNKDKPKYPEWKHQEPGTGDPDPRLSKERPTIGASITSCGPLTKKLIARKDKLLLHKTLPMNLPTTKAVTFKSIALWLPQSTTTALSEGAAGG